MHKIHFKRPVKVASGFVCLFLIGLAAAIIIAGDRNSLAIRIPFAIATLVSCGAVWWGHHGDRAFTSSAPFGADKITPDSSNARPTKPLHWDYPSWL